MPSSTLDPRLAQVPAALLQRAALLATVGSTAHGVSVSTSGPEGDDLDLTGTFVPPRHEVYGLHDTKTITWRSQPEGQRSQAGDVDFTLHPLRKFVSLAFKGNPTILAVLFSPEQWSPSASGTVGHLLLRHSSAFCSKSAGRAFQGYAQSQYLRLMGERGQMAVKRQELIDAHGYDVKYAAHTLRLCHQGTMVMREARMPMPLEGEAAEFIKAVRRGEVGFDECMVEIQAQRAVLDREVERTHLPDLPNKALIDNMLIQAHHLAWMDQDFRQAALEHRAATSA